MSIHTKTTLTPGDPCHVQKKCKHIQGVVIACLEHSHISLPSEKHHLVRTKILESMETIAPLIFGTHSSALSKCSSIADYLTQYDNWVVYKPSSLDKTLSIPSVSKAIYLTNTPIHYDVVLAVHAVINSNDSDNKKCKGSIDNSTPSKKAKIDSQQLLQ